MSNREASLQELLGSAFQSQMNNINTAIPCVVIAVRDNGNGAMVDIQPTINQKFKDSTVKERPPILGVPVSFPVSSTSGVLFPIKVGTIGTAIFSMRGLEIWKNGNGLPSAPNTSAKFDKSDALFFPGIQPPGTSVANPAKHTWQHSNDDLVIFNNIGTGSENEIRLKPDGNIVINTNQDVEVNCDNATVIAQANISLSSSTLDITADSATFAIGESTWVGNITHTGNYTITGAATFNGIPFSTHKHTGVTAGPSTTGGPTA